MIGALDDEQRLDSLVEHFFRDSFSTDSPIITEAIKRLLAAGGKRLRPRVTLLSAAACGGRPLDHLQLGAYMELIHVATLIHDDVVDRADTRRGVNATAIDYGNRISVLAGDYLFAWIFKHVTANYPAPVPHILSATLADICDGEVLQLRALGKLDADVEAYVDVARKKTASLFAASAQCGAIMGGGGPESIDALRLFGQAYGIAFQMNDDLLDVTADQQTLGKPVGNDLAERKMTIPLILALRDGGAGFRALVERCYDGGDDDAIPAIVEGIAKYGGLSGTRREIARHVGAAKTALARLGASGAKAELERLADALIEDEENPRS